MKENMNGLLAVRTYMVRLIDFIGMRYCKAVILIQHYRSNINIFLPILLRKCLGEGYREVIESGYSVLWKTQSRVPNQPENVESSRNIHWQKRINRVRW
jgi:hypothetical protein